MYFCANYSSALLVIISVEKFVALYFPLKTKTICTVRIAKRVSLFTTIPFLFFSGIVVYIGITKTEPNGNKWCSYGNASKKVKQIIFGIVWSGLYSYGPFVIMIIANCAIIYKFISSKLITDESGPESTIQALSKSATRGTTMLLTVSFSFIILTAPIAIANILYKGMPDDVFTINVAIEYVNHSINCVLYCISGSRF